MLFASAGRMDFAQLNKVYASVTGNGAAARYSRKDMIDIRLVCGNPEEDGSSTSHAERYKLTIRAQVRRMTP